MSAIDDSIATLEKARLFTDSVAVGFSGGKDSLVVLDLCQRIFPKVVPFFMYLVPDLEVTNTALREAEERFGLKIMQFPHHTLTMLLKTGYFCDPSYKYDKLPEIKMRDIYDIVKMETGCKAIVTGAKASDSAWRRRYFNLTRNWSDMIYPIQSWNKLDVLGYLRTRGIPEPPSSGKQATGIGLDETSVLWLSDNYPEDFKKLCEVFPYAEARVQRRNFYPPEPKRGKKS